MYYSQDKEDEYLDEHFFHGKCNSKYIELGALDGKLYSNTKYFQDALNWSGVLIEPHPLKFQALKANRPKDKCFNHLVSNSKDPLNFKFFHDGHAAVSGVVDTLPESHNVHYYNNPNCCFLARDVMSIIPRSLTSIIKESKIDHFDFLSLDVEGHEYEVLCSWDFSVPIDVILIEMLDGNDNNNEKCREVLRNNGYTFHSSISRNEVYTKL